jgi:hypothetical protein
MPKLTIFQVFFEAILINLSLYCAIFLFSEGRIGFATGMAANLINLLVIFGFLIDLKKFTPQILRKGVKRLQAHGF